MKLQNILVAVAMMAGSVGAIGCATSVTSAVSDAVDEASAADDSTSEASNHRIRATFGNRFYGARVASRSYWSGRVGTRYYPHSYWAMSAPPRARYEYMGRAPSSRHMWVGGHQHWTGRQYMWVGGHWETRQAGRTWVQPHYNVVNGRHVFNGGHWL